MQRNEYSDAGLFGFAAREEIVNGSRNYPISYWVHRLKLGHAPAGVEATPEQIAHAHRVLHLLAVISE